MSSALGSPTGLLDRLKSISLVAVDVTNPYFGIPSCYLAKSRRLDGLGTMVLSYYTHRERRDPEKGFLASNILLALSQGTTPLPLNAQHSPNWTDGLDHGCIRQEESSTDFHEF